MQMQSAADKIIKAVSALSPDRQPLIIAIDGRCAAGKTTLAACLQKQMDCAVFHMDDYFLRPEQRTAERISEAGGNVDYERFYSEILLPLRNRAEYVTYQPYDCSTQSLKPPVKARACAVNIVEGSYSCHPALWAAYDFRVFLNISAHEQMERILQRNGEAQAAVFHERWIPLEERYFSAYQIEERCDLCIGTGEQ